MVNYPDPNNPNWPEYVDCNLGVNITYKTRYLPETMYLNHAHEMDDWQEKYDGNNIYSSYNYTGRWPTINVSGHVTHIKAGTQLISSWFGGRADNQNPALDALPYEAGNYIVETAGSGMIVFGNDAGYNEVIFSNSVTSTTLTITTPSVAGISLRLASTDPTNPLRIKKMYKQGTDYDATDPRFVSTWRYSKCFRFINPLWASDNFVVDTSGNRGLRIELSGVGAPSDASYYNVIRQITKGLLFSGTQTGASGIIREIDYRALIPDDWYPSALWGTWLIYQPLSPSTTWNFYEPIKIQGIANTFRIGKYYNWSTNVATTAAPPSGLGGIEGQTPFHDQWLGDGLSSYLNYPVAYSESRPVSYYKITKFMNDINAIGGQRRDAWILIPHLASNHYCSSIATYLRDNLTTACNLYIEANNEPWNPQFGHFRHFYNVGNYYGSSQALSNDPYEAGKRAMALSGYNQIKIFKSILSSTSRTIYGILNAQSTDTQFSTQVLGWSGMPSDVRSIIDGVAFAPYFCNRNEWISTEMEVSSVPQILRKIELTSVPLAVDIARTMDGSITGAGYKSFIYECGQHLDQYLFSSAGYAKAYQIQTSLQMGNIYFYYFVALKNILGFHPWSVPMHYASMTPVFRGSWWGLLEDYGAPLAKYSNGWLRGISQCNEPTGQSQGGSSLKALLRRSSKVFSGLARNRLNRKF